MELAKVSNFLESAPVAGTVCDPARRVVFANKPMEELCGYSREELQGEKPSELFKGEETNSDTLDAVEEKLTCFAPFNFTITFYDKTVEAYYAGVCMIPFVSGPESKRYYVSIVRKLSSLDEAVMSREAPAFRETFQSLLTKIQEG